MDPSILPETSVLPSGLNVKRETLPACPLRLIIFLPLPTSHSVIVGFFPLSPVASDLLSGLNANDQIVMLDPNPQSRTAFFWRFVASQRMTSPLSLPILVEASVLPSGLNAKRRTQSG